MELRIRIGQEKFAHDFAKKEDLEFVQEVLSYFKKEYTRVVEDRNKLQDEIRNAVEHIENIRKEMKDFDMKYGLGD